VPVTTVPIFLHLQPLLAPLSIPEPPILLLTDPAASSATTSTSSSSKEPAKHLHFIISLHDPAHSLRFTTTTQPVPGDWLEVEYEQSDWVEERLVDVLKTGIEVIAQDVSGPTSFATGQSGELSSLLSLRSPR
jgi:predicted membrane GTPase involved in stress response